MLSTHVRCFLRLPPTRYSVSSIDNQIDNAKQQQVVANRQRIRPMIETVLFLGRQEISFRGHRDSGSIANSCTENDGNFRSTLETKI